MEDRYTVFPRADTQVGGGERERGRGRWRKRKGKTNWWLSLGGGCAERKWDAVKETDGGREGEEHQMLRSSWSGRIPVWIRAPCLMRIINMACPAPLNAGEDWKMGDKNKTSQAYPHKIHEAGACKRDIAHAGYRKVLLNSTPRALALGNSDTYHSVELWTLWILFEARWQENQSRRLWFWGVGPKNEVNMSPTAIPVDDVNQV